MSDMTYRVEYTVMDGNGEPVDGGLRNVYIGRVTSKRVTTFCDIPKIVAIHIGAPVEHVRIDAAVRL